VSSVFLDLDNSFAFWHLEHFFGGFPSPPLNRAILSAKIYDILVGSILAKSYRNFSFSLGIGQLCSAYFQHDLSRNELRTENLLCRHRIENLPASLSSILPALMAKLIVCLPVRNQGKVKGKVTQ